MWRLITEAREALTDEEVFELVKGWSNKLPYTLEPEKDYSIAGFFTGMKWTLEHLGESEGQ